MSPLSYRQEREANFAQKKAERATVRSHFREKYRLPKVNFQAVLYSTCCMFGLPHRDTVACKHDHSTRRKKTLHGFLALHVSKICHPFFCPVRLNVTTRASNSERVRRDPDPAGGGGRGAAHRTGQDDCRGQPGGGTQAVSAGSAVQPPERGHGPAERQSPGHAGRPQKADGEL